MFKSAGKALLAGKKIEITSIIINIPMVIDRGGFSTGREHLMIWTPIKIIIRRGIPRCIRC
ncbi:MAG: hypothetical protein AAB257_06670, partial [Nitrospinota bacterium]